MIRSATSQDFLKVCSLLQKENLPTIDLEENLPHFFVETLSDEVVASVGMELYGNSALLRSMMVVEEYRNKGIASGLVQALMHYAKRLGVQKFFLITNTAENYFHSQGFVRVEKENVDKPVLKSKEFNGLCPASSVIMMKQL